MRVLPQPEHEKTIEADDVAGMPCCSFSGALAGAALFRRRRLATSNALTSSAIRKKVANAIASVIQTLDPALRSGGRGSAIGSGVSLVARIFRSTRRASTAFGLPLSATTK